MTQDSLVLATSDTTAPEPLSLSSTPPLVLASFWRRFIADVLDSLLLNGLAWLIEYGLLKIFYFGFQFLGGPEGHLPPFDEVFSGLFIQAFNLGIYFCIAFPYYVWGHFKYRSTVGKKVVGIEVVDILSLGDLSLKQAIIRFFSYGLSYALFGCGFLMALVHPEKLALHDVIAKTISIKSKKKENV